MLKLFGLTTEPRDLSLLESHSPLRQKMSRLRVLVVLDRPGGIASSMFVEVESARGFAAADVFGARDR